MLTPTSILRPRAPTLLAADTQSFAVVAGWTIFLVKAPFVPGASPDIADYTLATFATSTGLAVSSTGGLLSVDPATGDFLIYIKDPAGGWRWITTTLTDLPQTIYGFIAVDTDTGEIVYGGELFDTPVVLNVVGQSIVLGAIGVRIPVNYMAA